LQDEWEPTTQGSLGDAEHFPPRASGAKRDPWLLAAEIAVASASRSASLFAKIGTRQNADENLSLSSRSELSSALATLDMESGKTRKARQLFRQLLECPNENSVAQVEWANRQIGGLEIDRQLLEIPRSFEANANLSLAEGEWDYAVAHGTKWLRDQPFSKRPAIFISYVASLVEDYQRSIEILRRSLDVNPDDPMLINNLAFALASANKLDEAASILKRIDLAQTSDASAITLAATHGLLLFRAGFPDRGRELYQLAIRRANNQGIVKYRVMADLYLAREELMAGTPLADSAATRALAEASKLDDKDVALISRQVRKLREPRAARSPAGQ
jgi:tetratricopeptide (TPR) repeat protein